MSVGEYVSRPLDVSPHVLTSGGVPPDDGRYPSVALCGCDHAHLSSISDSLASWAAVCASWWSACASLGHRLGLLDVFLDTASCARHVDLVLLVARYCSRTRTSARCSTLCLAGTHLDNSTTTPPQQDTPVPRRLREQPLALPHTTRAASVCSGIRVEPGAPSPHPRTPPATYTLSWHPGDAR